MPSATHRLGLFECVFGHITFRLRLSPLQHCRPGYALPLACVLALRRCSLKRFLGLCPGSAPVLTQAFPWSVSWLCAGAHSAYSLAGVLALCRCHSAILHNTTLINLAAFRDPAEIILAVIRDTAEIFLLAVIRETAEIFLLAVIRDAA